MTKSTDNKATTPADVVAEAEKANLLKDATIPAQAEPVEEQNAGDTNEDQKDAGSEDKVTLKDRLKTVGEKLKANKKNIAITVGVVGAVALVAVKLAAKTVVEELAESEGWTDKDETDLEKKIAETPVDEPVQVVTPDETVTEVKVTKTKTAKA